MTTERHEMGDGSSRQDLLACHECDCIQRHVHAPAGASVLCVRCGHVLYRDPGAMLDHAVAWSLAGLILLLLANVFPVLHLSVGGQHTETSLFSGAIALHRAGQLGVAALVIGVLIVAPALLFLLQITVLLPLRNGRVIPYFVPCMRLLSKLNHWLMFDVFMLAIIVAVVKLTSLADVTAGPGLWAFCALMLAATASLRSYDVHLVWARYAELTPGQASGPSSLPPSPVAGRARRTALTRGMACCDICGLLSPCLHAGARCRRCASLLQPRKPDSLNRTWALLLAGYVLFIPANLLPITITSSLFGVQADTIMSGVAYFWHSGAYDLAIVIFVASVFVPLGKLLTLSYLAYSVQVGTVRQPQQRTRLYRMVEFVGKWSMLDVFVVALLAQLVQFSSLAAIEAGPGAIAFSAVVVVTMFAAMAFDPRLIWDPLEADSQSGAKSD